MGVFINHTNHPSDDWSEAQKKAAEAYGEIVDIPFPSIPADFSEEQVLKLVEEMAGRLAEMQPSAVLLQGEFTYSYALITILREHNITVLAACSERMAETIINEVGETVRRSVFRFVKFRRYEAEGDE